MIHSRYTMTHSVAWIAAITVFPSLGVSQALAQDLEWRFDYTKARQEALAKNKPLIIDFGSDNCIWCRKLDEITFRDPAIVQILNQQYIPLKIDATRNPGLVEALKIQNFPTLVYASPDGQILGSHEGFIEVPGLRDHLDRVVAAVSEPEWMLKNYTAAVKAREEGDLTKAITLLQPILEQGKGRTVHYRAIRQQKELEELVAVANQKAKEAQLAAKSAVDAVATAPVQAEGNGRSDLSQMFKTAMANRRGINALITLASRSDNTEQMRTRQAQELLNQARDDYRKQQYLACLDRCEILSTNYGDLSEGQEANLMASEIKKNPEWTKLACNQLGDRLCLLYMNLAENYLSKGEPQQAIYYLERIQQTAPNSRHADLAQSRLSQLQGMPQPRK